MGRTRRVVIGVLMATIATLSVSAIAPVSAHESGAASQFVSFINGERSSRGLPQLAVHGPMAATSCDWNHEMRDSGTLGHDPGLVGDADRAAPNWQRIGENVGVGASASELHSAFMNSTGHRKNILDAGFTHIGVCADTDSSARMWTTHRFLKLPNSPPPTTSPPPPPTTSPPSTSAPTTAPPPTTPPSSAPAATAVPASTTTTSTASPTPAGSATTVTTDEDGSEASSTSTTSSTTVDRSGTDDLDGNGPGEGDAGGSGAGGSASGGAASDDSFDDTATILIENEADPGVDPLLVASAGAGLAGLGFGWFALGRRRRRRTTS